MIDKVRPLKFESAASGGTENDEVATEMDPAEDYLASKGIAFENSNSHLIDRSAGGELQWKDTVQTAYKTLNSLSSGVAGSRFTIICGFDGTGSPTRWLEFSANNPSNASPFIVPKNCQIIELTLGASSSSTGTVTVYKNGSSVGTLSLSAQTSNYASSLSYAFSAGDTISAAVTSGSISKPQLGIFIKND